MNPENVAVKKKKSRHPWAKEEVIKLLEFLKPYQSQTGTTKMNGAIYHDIASKFLEAGFVASAEEIQAKLYNLKTKYKHEKAIYERTNRPPSWEFWSIMDDYMTHTQADNYDFATEEDLGLMSDIKEEEMDYDINNDTSKSNELHPTSPIPSMPASMSSDSINSLTEAEAGPSTIIATVPIETTSTNTLAKDNQHEPESIPMKPETSTNQTKSKPIPVDEDLQRKRSFQDSILKELKHASMLAEQEIENKYRFEEKALELKEKRLKMTMDFFKESVKIQQAMLKVLKGEQ